MLSRLFAAHPPRLHLALMLALTFSTGVVDAVGYLGLERVFTGNMTGNVVILGMGLTGAEDLPVLGPALALGGFMTGAAASGRVLRSAGPGWSHRTTALFTAIGAVMTTIGVVLFVSSDLGNTATVATTTVLGVAMGAQAATARFLAVSDVTTVAVTSTVAGLAADSALGASTGAGSARRATAIALILAGAAVGALLLNLHVGAGLLLSAAITLTAAVAGHLHASRGTASS